MNLQAREGARSALSLLGPVPMTFVMKSGDVWRTLLLIERIFRHGSFVVKELLYKY